MMLKKSHILIGFALIGTIVFFATPTTSIAEDVPPTDVFPAKGKWGNIKGQLTYQGEIKVVAPIITAGAKALNAEICSVKSVPNEELLIDPKSKGIKNCVIWVKQVEKMHPCFEKRNRQRNRQEQTMEIKNCTFVPHVLVVQKGQTFKIKNGDSISHNVKTNFLNNPNESVMVFRRTIRGQGDMIFSKQVQKSELLPMPVDCSIYSWMRAYCMVLEHPYFAVTDKEGKFEIKNLPEGDHDFIFWQEKAGFLNRHVKVKIEDGKTTVFNRSFSAKTFE